MALKRNRPLVFIIIHHYVPSVVNRSAVMDLHRSRSCATLIQSLYDIFVHSGFTWGYMLIVHNGGVLRVLV